MRRIGIMLVVLGLVAVAANGGATDVVDDEAPCDEIAVCDEVGEGGCDEVVEDAEFEACDQDPEALEALDNDEDESDVSGPRCYCPAPAVPPESDSYGAVWLGGLAAWWLRRNSAAR